MSNAETPPPPTSLKQQLFGLLKRPIEYGLTGAALVGVLFLASRSDILPKVFKGAGFEVEFQEKVIQTTADTEQGIKVLRSNVNEMRAEIAALRRAIEDGGPVAIAAEVAADDTTGFAAAEDADGASKDSLLVHKDQLIQTAGYMWLGTFDSATQAWTDSSVQPVGEGRLPAPNALGTDPLILTTTVNIREAYPPNNETYFRAVRALGIAETGTTISLLAPPQSLDRAGVQQIWAHVDVALRPYIGQAAAE